MGNLNPETYRVSTPVTLPDWDLIPESIREILLRNEITPIIFVGQGPTMGVYNADIVPNAHLDVTTGNSENAYGAEVPFGFDAQEISIYCETNAVDVQIIDTDGNAYDAIWLPIDLWVPLDITARGYKVKSHVADSAGAYQIVALG